MECKVLKVAAKRSDKGNFTQVYLQVSQFSVQEQQAFLGRSNFGVYSDSPWLKFELEIERALQLSVDGIEFWATLQRVKLSRPNLAISSKVVLQLQKNICEADLLLSTLVGTRDEEGAWCVYDCEITCSQIEANLEGGE